MARFAVPLQKGHLPEGVTGSNLLLNIGPDASGQIPAKAVEVFEGIGKWFEQNGDSIYGTKAGGVSMGKKVVPTRKGDMLYIHFLDPAVKEFAFLLGGKKTTVKCERAEGDVSDIVVRFPLGGKDPVQYVEPGSQQMWRVVGQTCKNPGNAKAAIDDNKDSLWHSHPEPMAKNDPLPPPQSFTVDCGAVREMRGFTYTPRPVADALGTGNGERGMGEVGGCRRVCGLHDAGRRSSRSFACRKIKRYSPMNRGDYDILSNCLEVEPEGGKTK